MSATCTHLHSIELTKLLRHASAHAREARHPVARPAEPGEDWSCCYLDGAVFPVTDVGGEPD